MSTEIRFNHFGFTGRSTRGVLVLIALLLITRTAKAGQFQAHGTAVQLQRDGDLVAAEMVLQGALREARAAGPHSVKVAKALATLGVFYQDIGRFSQAESAFTGSLKILRGTGGQEDIALAPVIIHLVWLYVETGRIGEANRLHPQSWVDRLTLLDPESSYLPMLLEILAGMNALQGRYAAARDIYRKDFDLLSKRGMDSSAEMASALNNFGFIELRAGRYSEALNNFSKALELWLQLLGPDDLQVAMSRLGLAKTHIALGRYDYSSELLRQVLPVFEQKCGPSSLRTEDVLIHYADALRHQKRRDEARKLQERARQIRRASAADLPSPHVIDVRDVGLSQNKT